MNRLAHERTRRPLRGFTLIELLVGAAIMTVALMIIYQIWSMISSNANTEIWASDINKKLTNADTRVREYLARAGYPTQMTPQGIRAPDSASQAGYFVKITSAGGSVESEGTDKPTWRVFDAQGTETGEGVCVLSFYRVEPGSAGVEGNPNKAINCQRIQVFMRRPHKVAETKANLVDLVMVEGRCTFSGSDTLDFSPATLNTPPTPGSTTPFTMVADVSRIRLSARTQEKTGVDSSNGRELGTGDKPSTPCLVRLEIDCIDPQRGRRHVFKRIEGETHVGVDMTVSL